MRASELRPLVQKLDQEQPAGERAEMLFDAPTWVVVAHAARALMLVGAEDDLLVRVDGGSRMVQPVPTAWVVRMPNGDLRLMSDAAFASAYEPAAKPIVDQPPPVPQAHLVPTWLAVISDMERRCEGLEGEELYRVQEAIADMRERDRVGRERYGTPLTPLNGRDQVVDMYQEQLDASVYARAAIQEGIAIDQAQYNTLLDNIIWTRTFLTNRERAKESP